LGLSRLFFVPAAQSPFKPEAELAPPGERLRLLRLALAGQPRYAIDTSEIERGGVSYSIETVREYVRLFPGRELWTLIGGDHVRLLPQWRAADELAERVKFAVIPRPGQTPDHLPEPFHGQFLRGWPLDVSASEIRDRVRKGLSIEWLVPPGVAEAIRNNRLYL
jgi:nicotinate-nucleotide adenylyltransferase